MRTYPFHSLATLQQRQLLYFVLGLAGGAWIEASRSGWKFQPEAGPAFLPTLLHTCPSSFLPVGGAVATQMYSG